MRLLTCTETVMKGRVSDVSQESRRGRRHRGRRRWLVGTAPAGARRLRGRVRCRLQRRPDREHVRVDRRRPRRHRGRPHRLGERRGLQASIDVPSGSSDNSFGQGTKEDDPANDRRRLESRGRRRPPAGVSRERDGRRADVPLISPGSARSTPAARTSTSSSTRTQPRAGPPRRQGDVTINRTEGDLLFTYDFGGSGTPTLGAQLLAHQRQWPYGQRLHSVSRAHASVLGQPPHAQPKRDTRRRRSRQHRRRDRQRHEPRGRHAYCRALRRGCAQPLGDPWDLLERHLQGVRLAVRQEPRVRLLNDAELKDFIAPSPNPRCQQLRLDRAEEALGRCAGYATLKIGTTAGASDTASQAVSGAGAHDRCTEVENLGNYHLGDRCERERLHDIAFVLGQRGMAFDPGQPFRSAPPQCRLHLHEHAEADQPHGDQARDQRQRRHRDRRRLHDGRHGTSANPADFPARKRGHGVTLDAGSYSVIGDRPLRLHGELSAGCSGTIALGETQDLHGHQQRHRRRS